jgi:hypothetical protein
LVNWTAVGSITLDATGLGYYTDSSINGLACKFYQLSNGTNISQTIGFEAEVCLAGISTLADQLIAPDNTLNGVFTYVSSLSGVPLSSLPNDTVVDQWNGTGFGNYTWSQSGGWSPNGSLALLPGVGALINNPTTNGFVVTFTGTVQGGPTGIMLPADNNCFVTSVLPKAGGVQTVLGYDPQVNDSVEAWAYFIQGYELSEYLGPGNPSGTWNPTEPVIGIGESFFLIPSTNNVWMEHY